MNEDLVRRVKNTLKLESYSMNDIWLRDCIEYFTSENNIVVYNEILKFVKTQWQLSDLREINNDNGCLPRNLSQQMYMVLHGSYILQMNKMYDISTSKYKQLEQIRNVSNVNIEVTEDVKPQIWEPKPKRMLLLHLTDGIQDITAIEYRTISSLNDTLIPGYKVMIIGPVKCRRGIILLEEGKFRVIGGEVESLSITNALENVLARALNFPENPDPYNDKDRQEIVNNKPPSTTNDFFEDDFEVNLEEVTEIEKRSQEMDNIQSTNNISNYKNIQNNLSNRTNIAQQSVVHSKSPANDNNINQNSNVNEVFDMDDELLNMIEEDQLILSTSYTSTSSTSKNTGSTDRDKNLIKPFRVLPKEGNNCNMEDDIVLVEDKDNRIEGCTKKDNKQKSNIDFPEDDFNFDDFDVLETVETKNLIPKTKESNAKGNFLHSKLFLKNNDSIKGKNSSETFKFKTNSISTNQASSSVQVDCQKEIGIKRPAASISPSLINSSKKVCIEETSSQKKDIRKITDFIKGKSFQQEIPAKICDFICDVIKETFKEITFKTVRGQFTTFGKLSRKNLCWQLEGTISDKTAALDVAVASEIIERFLGFSVKEFSQKRKLAKTNGDIEHELRMACRKAEQKLKQLDALLELELRSDQKAKVVNIRPLTDQQKIIIDKRLKALKI